VTSQVRKASYSLSNVVTYLNSNVESLIDYRTWQCAGGRISTGFVESSTNRIAGRRMCKSQHMRWSRVGTQCRAIARHVVEPGISRACIRPVSVDWTATSYVALATSIPAFLTASSNTSRAGRIQRRHRAFGRSSCSAHHSGSPYCNRTSCGIYLRMSVRCLGRGGTIRP
jgi:hypothetical protein